MSLLAIIRCVHIVEECLRNAKVSGLVIAEVNPNHDPESLMMERLVDQILEGFESRLMMVQGRS